MASRYQDWMRQAGRDLEHAKRSLRETYYEWACFAAQQAAEKALKAVYQKLGREAWGHSIVGLLDRLPVKPKPSGDLYEMAKVLDKHYIPPRYPNSYAEGAPFEYYTKQEAGQAINFAARFVAYCKSLVSRRKKGSARS